MARRCQQPPPASTITARRGPKFLIDANASRVSLFTARKMVQGLRGGSTTQLALNHLWRHSRLWEARNALRFAASIGTEREHLRPMPRRPSDSAADFRPRSRWRWRPVYPSGTVQPVGHVAAVRQPRDS